MHFHGRIEDHRLITGQGRYAADWSRPGQLHAVFVRADRAHARVKGIDTRAALGATGVVAVLTAADFAGEDLGQFPINGQYKGRNGTTLLRTHRPILATDTVRYVGDQVAVVIAQTEAAARDAADLVAVDYEDLPVVATVDDATAPGAPSLHENIPGNVCYEGETGDEAAVAAAFERAHHVTRIAVESNRVIGSALEPRAILASYDAASGTFHVYSPSQGVLNLRRHLMAVLKVPEDKILVEAHDVGGSFGVKGSGYPEHIVLMLAAKRLGKPVKWVSTRSEAFLTDSHGRALHMTGELALDRDGNFLATRFTFIADLGAYQTATGSFLATNNTALCAVGVYRTPAHYGRTRLVLTNTTPVAAYRGAGRPDVAYLNERLVDQAAAELRIDPAELRRRNFIPKEAFPYKTPNAATYDSGDFARGLALALEKAEYETFPRRRDASGRDGKLRGIGFAYCIEGTGAGMFPKDQAELKFDAQGNATLHTLSQTQGQGHETAFPLIVQQVLGLPIENIRLSASEPASKLIGNHTGGSRSTVGVGNASAIAARRVLDIAKRYAAEELGVEMAKLSFEDGTFKGAGKSLSFLELARRLGDGLPQGEPHPLDMLGEGTFGATFPSGVHVAEVEIDPDTGVVEVLDYTAVDDCGVVIEHTLVEGQIMGGVTQGGGQVLGEHGIYDRETGQLVTGSFMDYAMPRAGWLRDIRFGDNGVPSPNNPLGVKGVGESGTTASIPALTNAVLNGLRPLGIEHLDMPLTPAKIWQAIRSANAKAA